VPPSPSSRPLDATAIAVTIGLCLSWGFNNVAIKLAIHDIPPLIQSSARSLIAALLVGAWAQARGIFLFKRDGTLRAGILTGVLFALEFLLIYRGLVWTTATRGVLFLYLAPFFVVIGSRWLVPGDHFHLSQWLGLLLSFVGIVIAFGLPTPAADSRQVLGDLMLVGGAAAWAATTRGQHHLHDLVCFGRALFGRAPVGLYFPHAAFWGGGRAPCAWRAADPGFCRRGGAGRRRTPPRQPAQVRLYAWRRLSAGRSAHPWNSPLNHCIR